MDITNIALAADKITVTKADGSSVDFTVAHPPTNVVELHVGESLEVKAVA